MVILNDIKAERDAALTEVNALHEKILEAGGIKLKLATAQKTELERQLEVINRNIAKAEVAIEEGNKSLARTDKEKQKKLAEIEAVNESISDMEQKLERLLAEFSDIKTSFTKAQKQIDEKNDELTELKTKYDNARETSGGVRIMLLIERDIDV